MTDTQERVVRDQSADGQIFGLGRKLKSFIERFIYSAISACVVVVAVLFYIITSLEARIENLDHTIKSIEARIENLDYHPTIKSLEARFENLQADFDMLQRKLVHKNCAELYKSGKITSDVSIISPDGIGPDFEVFCDQKTAGGGWTVIQKRLDGSVNFNRGWLDYKNGFGDLNGELWLGLDKIHRLTKSPSKLRVDLEDFDGNTAYAEYDLFQVANESKKYQLSIKTYSGTAGDSLSRHHGYLFTTKDQDNDSYEGNCAKRHRGGWWYLACHSSNLNGFYYHGFHYFGKYLSFANGVNWFHWKGYYYSAKRAEMKIRPVEFQ